MCKYVYELRARTEHLVDRYTEDSALNYLTVCEEAHRGDAMEWTRDKNSPMRWGAALLLAQERHAHVWQDNLELLSSLRSGTSRPAGLELTPPPKRRRDKPPSSQAPGAGNMPRSRWATATSTKEGAKICKKFNDRRGCKGRCPDGKANVCDVVLASSQQCCGRRDHNRVQHNPGTHGARWSANRLPGSPLLR